MVKAKSERALLGGGIKSIDSITKAVKTGLTKPVNLTAKKTEPPMVEGYNVAKNEVKTQIVDTDYRPSFWHRDLKINFRTPEKKTSSNGKGKKARKVVTDKNKKPLFVRVLVGILKVFALTVSLTALLFSGAVYAYKESYDTRAMFGTKILGEDVGGKTEQEILEILKKKISALTFSFKIDENNVVIKPEEAGVTFNPETSAKEAVFVGKTGNWYRPYMHASASLVYRLYKPAGEKVDKDIRANHPLTYTLDEAKLTGFSQNLSTRFDVAAQNAGLVMNGTEVQVIPAAAGRKIVVDTVKQQLNDALSSVRSTEILIDVEEIDPNIVEADTKESIAKAKTLLEQSVVYRYNGQTFTPDKLTVAKWIIFNTVSENGEDKLVPVFDPSAIYSYVYGLAGKINVPAVNKKITVKNGAEQVVEQEGKDGLAVDIDQAAKVSADNLTALKGLNLELPTYTVKSKTQVNNIIVADWSKYIEVNLATQTMTAYLAGGTIVNSWAITSGAYKKGYATPTGTFLIRDKHGEGGADGNYGGGVCMPNPPSSTPLCNINYVSDFTGQGHAIHEAWWRRSPGDSNYFGNPNFGWNGSHGCVNATYEAAKFIFYWAPIGTPVIIHW